MFVFLELLVWASLLLILWTYIESQNRIIKRRKVSIKKKIPQTLKILHLSDIHFSGRDATLSRFFDKLAQEEYDFVFVSGDIFDSMKGISMAIKNFKKLKATNGVFAVFGNHDYYDYRFVDVAFMGFRGRMHPKTRHATEKMSHALSEAGVKLLLNETLKIKKGDTTFSIHGLDDPTTGRADIEKTMHHYKAEHVNILLTHTVDAFFYIGENEIDLSFSGHSHGGQIRFPFVGALVTHTQYGPKYADGLHPLKGAMCSISRGMGASRFFFLRLLCRPEAIVLEVSN